MKITRPNGKRSAILVSNPVVVIVLIEPFYQVKPKSSFIYYYGDMSSKQSANPDEEKEEIPDADVLNMEPVIPSKPR